MAVEIVPFEQIEYLGEKAAIYAKFQELLGSVVVGSDPVAVADV